MNLIQMLFILCFVQMGVAELGHFGGGGFGNPSQIWDQLVQSDAYQKESVDRSNGPDWDAQNSFY